MIFRLFLFITLLISNYFYLNAQSIELWGITELGGTYNGGTIFSFDHTQSKHTKEYEFFRTEAKVVGKSLVQASDGKVYGISTFSMGIIFQYDPITQEYLNVYDFDYYTAYRPNYGLIEGTNGKLYGTTRSNGRYGNGVLFEFDVNTKQLTVLYEFLENSYERDDGRLMQASNGKLYGLTSRGPRGYIYEFDLTSNTYTALHNFSVTDGFRPEGHLVEGEPGVLYGVSEGGGTDNEGVMFKYNTISNRFNLILDFNSNTNSGSRPTFSPVKGSDGMIYGMARKVIYIYDSSQDSFEFIESPFFGSAGTLSEGEPNMLYFPTNTPNGAIAKFDMVSKSVSLVQEFSLDDDRDYSPKYDFLFLDNTRFLGISRSKQCFSDVLFEFDVTSNKYTSIIELNCGFDGANPEGKLIQASNKKLYGYLTYGGNNQRGSVFEFDPATKTKKIIAHLADSMGISVIGNLFEYVPNKLLFVTKDLGAGNDGKLYQLDITTGNLSLLYNFNTKDHYERREFAPEGSFTLASNGKIYGFSEAMGVTVSEIDPLTASISTKHVSLTGDYFFNGGFVEGSNGKFYGSTWAKGRSFINSSYGAGTIIEYDLQQNQISIKAEMYDAGIANPKSNLIKSVLNGYLYGTASNKGNNNQGGIFMYDYELDQLSKVIDMDSALYGSHPEGDLIQTTDGMIYGYCTEGGAFNSGTIFKFNPLTNTLNKVYDFNKSQGNNPSLGGLTIVEVCRPASKPKLHVSKLSYCRGDSIALNIDSTDKLNNTEKWSLYNGEGSLIESNAAGSFIFEANKTNQFLVRGEGGCFGISPGSSINIEVLPNLNIKNCDPELISKAENANYLWLNLQDSSETNGANEQTFVPIKNGTYAVIVDQGGCRDTSSAEVIINAEVLENSFQEAIIFGPNPTKRELIVNLRKCYEETTVRVTKLNGSLVKDQTFYKQTKIQLLNNLPNDFYFIEIKTKSGEKALLKAIKN